MNASVDNLLCTSLSIITIVLSVHCSCFVITVTVYVLTRRYTSGTPANLANLAQAVFRNFLGDLLRRCCLVLRTRNEHVHSSQTTDREVKSKREYSTCNFAVVDIIRFISTSYAANIWVTCCLCMRTLGG